MSATEKGKSGSGLRPEDAPAGSRCPRGGDLRRTSMLLKRIVLLAAALTSAAGLSAQTFDLDQFDQLFRPRLRMEGRWLPPVGAEKGSGTYEDRSALAILTVPIHSTFNVNAKLDLTADNIVELLKNGVRVRASQVMGNLRYGTRQVLFDEALGGTRTLHTASIGALGVSLTKKYRILFWSLNANVSEEDKTFDRAVPRFGGVIGKMKVNGLRKQFFYGLAASFTDGLTLPVPFIGGSAPIGKKWSFNYVLPLQASFGWKVSGATRLNFGAGLEASRSGIQLDDHRYNMNYGGLRAFASARHKLSKHFGLRAEVGYLAAHRVRIGDGDDHLSSTVLQPGLSCMVGVNVLFGHSILDRILEEVLK